MPQEQTSVTQEHADRLAAKLQSFCDSLPEGERQIMAAIMSQATQGVEVSGFATPPSTMSWGYDVKTGGESIKINTIRIP